MSAGLLALFCVDSTGSGFADKNWLNTPDKIWSRSPDANSGRKILTNTHRFCGVLFLFQPQFGMIGHTGEDTTSTH